ncbi:MAG: 16S rRNA (cytosine(1402)-N(4))-methyltransferase RsmH [Oscillospiraceae bacterium]|nr:16S rRNA (cytosine(1402)-N(4))-methyltransferase RsmH [Oscillospiraceae bacterium]
MEHLPVLLKECLEGLDIRPGGTYVDATLGRGGHSQEILKRLGTGRLIGIDRDADAIEETAERLSVYGDRFIPVRGNFRELGSILDGIGIDRIDGALFDLGVSSPQLDDAERGFSYMHDAPLDMRMDRSETLTASDVVNGWPYEELRRILYEYGEERYAPQIASAIVRTREKSRIDTTYELVDVIRSALPAKALREKQHPAKRSFQAIRIAVNDELGAIPEALEAAMDRLRPGGRLCVISFHSLEDRLVKNAIASRENGCTCPKDLPVCVCGFVRTMRGVGRKPVLPTEEEINVNPRARSAKLRIAERVADDRERKKVI